MGLTTEGACVRTRACVYTQGHGHALPIGNGSPELCFKISGTDLSLEGPGLTHHGLV